MVVVRRAGVIGVGVEVERAFLQQLCYALVVSFQLALEFVEFSIC